MRPAPGADAHGVFPLLVPNGGAAPPAQRLWPPAYRETWAKPHAGRNGRCFLQNTRALPDILRADECRVTRSGYASAEIHAAARLAARLRLRSADKISTRRSMETAQHSNSAYRSGRLTASRR